MAEVFDVIVVGGGTAGCVLASRLTEDLERRVLVVEGGPDYGSVDRLPDDVRSAASPTYSHDWGFRSEADGARRAVRLPRAMVTGGCSATNAAVAVRGAPSDYDRWAELGAAGWSWDEVLPWFRTLERDLDFVDEWHGADGPVPIRRYEPDELSAVQAALLRGAAEAGHPSVEDHNRPGALGAGVAPTNAVDGVRISTAIAYLWPAAARENLTIRSDAIVSTVSFAGDRVVGVILATGEEIRADKVVLAAGAYCTPAILLRSGIGAADVLPAGIDSRVELPAVGENLQDHPMVPLVWQAPEEAAGGPTYQSLVTLAPNTVGAPTVQLLPASAALRPGSATPPTWALAAAILKPASRGCVRISGRDPAAGVHVDIGHLTDEADIELLRHAVEAARSVAATDAVRPLIVSSEVIGPPSTDADDFASVARQLVTTYHHPVGTCAMGDDHGRSVVNGVGQVHNLPNLFVADASVMPEIPSANTNVPTIMIAERVAHIIRTT